MLHVAYNMNLDWIIARILKEKLKVFASKKSEYNPTLSHHFIKMLNDLGKQNFVTNCRIHVSQVTIRPISAVRRYQTYPFMTL